MNLVAIKRIATKRIMNLVAIKRIAIKRTYNEFGCYKMYFSFYNNFFDP